jgi:FkbM family methyltransferase
MNILSELKKRFSPNGKHRLALRGLKKIKKKYPDDVLLKTALRTVTKKIFSVSGLTIVKDFRGHLMNMLLDELELKNRDICTLNDIQIKLHKYPNYEYITIYEYIDIVLSDLYFKQKISHLTVLSEILSCFPQEGPYQWKKVHLKKGDVVIDAGGNIGLFSLFAAKYYNCKSYAFEPFEEILPVLKKNIQMNGLDDLIHVCPYGLSNANNTAIFNIARDNIGASSIVLSDDKNPNNNMTEIQCVSLDSWVEENQITKIDFIKADIEGAERLLLQGATKVLQTFQPKLSICTYHLPDDKQVLERIIKKANPNYKIVHVYQKLYAYVPEKYMK